ncbi:MAG: hypothetical protein CSA38_02080 [Flavobacteriales bacterium]|nr:MAG: hypothetical protein CSA38_02080 [Flavobacteriales bacterium]
MRKKNKQGIFCISLDFELYWGIRDKKTVQEYGQNVEGAWRVVPKLLDLFKKYDVHATWAVVGAMVCENQKELFDVSPKIKPQYADENLSPYGQFYEEIHQIEAQYIFGKSLLKMVEKTPFQEIGTHTFSHYYCLEKGQNKASFLSDLSSALHILKKNNITAHSFIFPRHQHNPEYINEFKNYGITTYRGTEKIWYNSSSVGAEEGIVKRAVRYADYFLKMGSHHCQDITEVKQNGLYNIRASRWLRPYSKKLEKLDFLKMRRIKNQMTYAAKNGKIFQLWFHPHDIGSDIDKNFEYLDTIFEHYQYLKEKYRFKSLNFKEIKDYIDGNH